MNRNQMYDYLMSLNLKPLFRYKNNGKTYHIEFVPNRDYNQEIEAIMFDWGYIRGVSSIHLCSDEIVVEGGFGNYINVKYHKMEKFEVRIFED